MIDHHRETTLLLYSCVGKYISVTPVNQVKRQLGVRFYWSSSYTWSGFCALSKKNRFSLNMNSVLNPTSKTRMVSSMYLLQNLKYSKVLNCCPNPIMNIWACFKIEMSVRRMLDVWSIFLCYTGKVMRANKTMLHTYT